MQYLQLYQSVKYALSCVFQYNTLILIGESTPL